MKQEYRLIALMKWVISFAIFFGGADLVFAQLSDAIVLKEALVLKFPDKYRYAVLPVDPIELQMVSGTWSMPLAGDRVKFDAEETSTWESVIADEDGWFRGKSFGGGYACLSYQTDAPQLLILEGMTHEMVYVNGKPRAGNRYQYAEEFESWAPKFNYSLLPVEMKKGINNLLFRCNRGQLKVKLHKQDSMVFFNSNDLTVPDLIIGESTADWAAIVIVNATESALKNCTISAALESNPPTLITAPVIQPMTIRKIGFRVKGQPQHEKGEIQVRLKLIDVSGKINLAETTLILRSVHPHETHRCTFISGVDGSVQYYAVNPARGEKSEEPKALFLSLHGASVEAINQVNAYDAKTWGHIVAPTNRRPYGFNWEDWGRLDGLEVLAIAQQKFNIDPDRIYLTGHSMGGHGTWQFGAMYPDQFAAIGPSAGWISFWSYGVRESFENSNPVENMLTRASLPSNPLALADNYRQHGVYILHGSEDDNVPAEESRQMVAHLEKSHIDFVYHEEKGAGHWWDYSDAPGADCVDWAPLFDFFARHARPGKTRLRQVDFMTVNPGISATCNWVTIENQIEQLKISSVSLRYDPGVQRVTGSTQNVSRLALEVCDVDPEKTITVEIDSQTTTEILLPRDASKIWLERRNGLWKLSSQPALSEKGPHRYGTFKDAFRNRFMFVVGTKGSKQENQWALNKARFDAEWFWYQGNGSIDIIADVDFDPSADVDRGIILYGNAHTNAAWQALLGDSPVQVRKGIVQIGERKLRGDDLACLFIRPRPGSDIACVAAVSGTGLVGMRLTDRRRYLSPGYAHPDCIVYSPEILRKGSAGVRAAGFFGNDWRVASGDFVWNE
ncbi:prolyl oligopeptidase family serine peptidase [candidate division KSB1 bacterium]|nr:prolyl oligopeptidase family serine peptidase [candidate division KSB1 bacterium]